MAAADAPGPSLQQPCNAGETARSEEVHLAEPRGRTPACPYDGSGMRRVESGGVTIDRCGSCGSIWLDLSEFRRIPSMKALAARLDPPGAPAPIQKPKALLCPRDHSRLIEMTDLTRARLKFHSCKVCGGRFFDAGELRDAAHHPLLERIKAFFMSRRG